MANFVLVHGAWGGKYMYGEVPAGLRAAGHQVLETELPGIGTRQGELHPGITLSDHVNDALKQIAASGFDRFILVGHSYGGIVIGAIAAVLGSKIDAICYVDAFLPEDGKSLWDLTGEFERSWIIGQQKHRPGMVPPIGDLEFKVAPGKRGYQPLLTFLEAVTLTGEENKIPRRAYVFATGYFPTPFKPFADQAKADPAWDYHEIATSHFVMAEQPDGMVEILLGLAS